MPQIAKSAEQISLEDRIAKATSLVKTMRLQLASVRKRNKAERERLRRMTKCKDLEKKGEEMFGKLMEDVAQGPIMVQPMNGNKQEKSDMAKENGKKSYIVPQDGVSNLNPTVGSSGSSSSKSKQW